MEGDTKMPRIKLGGFSLLEMLTCMMLFSLLALAAQGLLVVIQRQQLMNTSLDLYTLIQLSRTHALSHNTRVTLCPLTSGEDCSERWNKKLTVFVDPNGNRKLDDNELLLQMIELPSGLNLTWKGMGSGSNLHFNSQGQTFVTNGTFTLRIGEHSRQVILNRQGKPRISD